MSGSKLNTPPALAISRGAAAAAGIAKIGNAAAVVGDGSTGGGGVVKPGEIQGAVVGDVGVAAEPEVMKLRL